MSRWSPSARLYSRYYPSIQCYITRRYKTSKNGHACGAWHSFLQVPVQAAGVDRRDSWVASLSGFTFMRAARMSSFRCLWGRQTCRFRQAPSHLEPWLGKLSSEEEYLISSQHYAFNLLQRHQCQSRRWRDGILAWKTLSRSPSAVLALLATRCISVCKCDAYLR